LKPRWKYRRNLAQETLALRVRRLTEGHDVAFLSPEQLAETMPDAGLEVSTNHQVDRRRPHPHHLVVGRVPVGAAPGNRLRPADDLARECGALTVLARLDLRDLVRADDVADPVPVQCHRVPGPHPVEQ